MRDLSDDAGRADRLLTIPDCVLAACGLDKPALARASAGDRSVDVAPLSRAIVAHADSFRAASKIAIADLSMHIGVRERAVIETLFVLYDAQFAAIGDRPDGIADGSVALDKAAIGAILRRLDGAR